MAEADAIERRQGQHAVFDPQAHLAVMAMIEIGMCCQESIGLAGRAFAEAIDEVMPIALHMAHTDQVDQSQILLQRHAGMHGEVFR